MAHMSMNQYLQQVNSLWLSKDGYSLAELLSFRHGHVLSSKLQLENPEPIVEDILSSPLDELVSAHLRCIYSINNQAYMEAYRYQNLLTQALTKAMQTQREENWCLPVLTAVCYDLRRIATRADKELFNKGNRDMETLENAVDTLMGCFRLCTTDNRSSEETTKRWGMLAVVNQLFKVYFKINKIHLLKPLIRAIESSPFRDSFPISQLVTYRYFVGCKAMFDSDYKTADEALTFAFQRCNKNFKKNKQLILVYLVPVKLLNGYRPKKSLLLKYSLMPFWAVTEAVLQGNVVKFMEEIRKNEAFFTKYGIFLILEKLKIIALRNLFKKVYLILNMHQIPLRAFHAALDFVHYEDLTAAETECIVANLIFEGRVKGYISHQHQKLVVSKQNAFPPLTGIGAE